MRTSLTATCPAETQKTPVREKTSRANRPVRKVASEDSRGTDARSSWERCTEVGSGPLGTEDSCHPAKLSFQSEGERRSRAGKPDAFALRVGTQGSGKGVSGARRSRAASRRGGNQPMGGKSRDPRSVVSVPTTVAGVHPPGMTPQR